MVVKLTFGNFKGGVGKTTSACMTALLLQERGYDVLFIDFDPQADSTQFLTDAFHYQLADDYVSLYEVITQKDLRKGIISLSENLDLIPSGTDLLGFNDILREVSKGKVAGAEHFYLDALLDAIVDDYDFVIFDVPPTLNDFNYNALVASDYVLVVLQTQRKAFNQTKKYLHFIEEMQQIMEHFEYPPVQHLGVLTYLQKRSGAVDAKIVEQSKEAFGDLLFDARIFERERVKRYDEEGINMEDHDMHDKDVFDMYNSVVDEILQRLNQSA